MTTAIQEEIFLEMGVGWFCFFLCPLFFLNDVLLVLETSCGFELICDIYILGETKCVNELHPCASSIN